VIAGEGDKQSVESNERKLRGKMPLKKMEKLNLLYKSCQGLGDPGAVVVECFNVRKEGGFGKK